MHTAPYTCLQAQLADIKYRMKQLNPDTFKLILVHSHNFLMVSFLSFIFSAAGMSKFIGRESPFGQQKWVNRDYTRPRHIATNHKQQRRRSRSPNTDRDSTMAVDSGTN